MPGARENLCGDRVTNDEAAVLRHDLVTPINLIVGYCELLMIEASESGESSRLAPLRSLRNSGFGLLRLVDGALLSDAPDRSVADLRELAQALNGPASDLVQTCDALSESSFAEGHPTEFADDLQKIREAGLLMVEMAESLAQGRDHDGDEDGARTRLED